SLDVLSGGRVILGVGVGWMREEFEVLGMPYDHRGRRADEQLEVFRTLFTAEHPSHSGADYSFPEVGVHPTPVNGRVPISGGANARPGGLAMVLALAHPATRRAASSVRGLKVVEARRPPVPRIVRGVAPRWWDAPSPVSTPRARQPDTFTVSVPQGNGPPVRS